MGANESYIPSAVEVFDTGNPNESPIYNQDTVLRENGGTLISTFRCLPEADTTLKLLKGARVKYGKLDCVGERIVNSDGSYGEYKFITYEDFYNKVEDFSRGLAEIGMKPGEKIGIYSANSLYWQETAYGAQMNSMVPVPVYDSLGANSAEYILNHSEAVACVVSQEKFNALISIAGKLQYLKHIIVMGPIPHTDITVPQQISTCADIEELGKGKQIEFQYPEPDTIALIMYTSGSTGKPKGCVLLHRNIIAGAAGLGNLGGSISTSDTYMSFLPLAHIYAMGVETIMFAQGARIGFYTGNIKNLTKDFQALRPTIICGVPRVFNRIVDTMQAKIAEIHGPKKILVEQALKLKMAAVRANKPHSQILDWLVFSNFTSVLGGRVRMIVSGGAPILPDVYYFLAAAITPNIIQGYGLTEVAASVAVTQIPCRNATSLGAPVICTDLKFRKVEGMMYDPRGNPPCGEIMVRGKQVFSEYYKEPALTEEALIDGWFATGDIGVLTSDGHVQIIDRAKQLVKLSQGEYISITTLNDVYGRAEGVNCIYVFADSHHDAPAAVVVPTKALLDKWKSQSITDPVHSDVAKKELIDSLLQCATDNKLRGFERIKAVLIDTEEFTVENGLLTPSMKPQWQALRKKYEAAILNELK